MQSDSSELLDSLPYYDDDLEKYPELREKVERELGRELKPPQALHPRVPPPIALFEGSPLLEAEMIRVESHQPLEAIDTIKFQLPAPASDPASQEEWQAALENAKAQLEHQRIRHANLALLQQYGSNAWRIHNYLLESTAKQLEQAVEEVSNLTTDVNRERKNSQLRLGEHLTSLERRWTELISSVLQIEMANVALDKEVDRLNQREAELADMS